MSVPTKYNRRPSIVPFSSKHRYMAPVQGPCKDTKQQRLLIAVLLLYRKFASGKTVKGKHRFWVHHINQRQQTAVFIVTLLMSAWRHLHYSFTKRYPVQGLWHNNHRGIPETSCDKECCNIYVADVVHNYNAC